MPIIWELDFYSRPLVDEQNKKLWEVLICESPLGVGDRADLLFRYTRLCSNAEVNSTWLRQAIEAAIAQTPKRPDKIRFFRRQMNNMILKGCEEAGVPAYPSRRTIALHQWIQQRMQAVYPTYANYQLGTTIPATLLANAAPQRLPDALLGQQWAFVTLLAQNFADFSEWEVAFGEVFPLDLVGIPSETQIPGVVIFSSRALPMAGWMSGLELAFLRYSSAAPPQLVLETGASDSWILASLNTPQLQAEAQNFEAAKQQAQNVHFIAVQSDPQAESFAGFWLLQELNLA
jgi:hypothetical protein